eukprot:CAMPEP_0174910480 /NCGR_PEP_ID=MMETSP0167-20121228/72798_1 /TAXON_ID=38298 /ORGANISM="Rhodella maculata, Strain CCMP736" /LENGTH=34 /DNA_ID= /DNA_START= /DNA_END= /DNA_ORIENTATION=
MSVFEFSLDLINALRHAHRVHSPPSARLLRLFQH